MNENKETITIRGVTYNPKSSKTQVQRILKAYFGSYPKLKEFYNQAHTGEIDGTTENLQTVSKMEVPTKRTRPRNIADSDGSLGL